MEILGNLYTYIKNHLGLRIPQKGGLVSTNLADLIKSVLVTNKADLIKMLW